MVKKHPNMTQALKRFRRAIEQDINEKALRMGEEDSKYIAENMMDYCKNLLTTRATPASQSTGLISQIAESIHIEDAGGETSEGRAVFSSTKNNKKRLKGKVLRVPVDKDRLVMFLEYGTGLEGKAQNHPEASSIGWEYAVNDGTQKAINRRLGPNHSQTTIYKNWYVKKYGRRGFVFKYKGKEYLDKKDRIFKNAYRESGDETAYFAFVRGGINKKTGKKTRDYFKKVGYGLNFTPSKKTYAFSSGLKPIRFIYDTRKNGVPEILETMRKEKEYIR